MDVSIIVPVRNEIAGIERCLESIRHQRLASSTLEILVLDGLSDDGTSEVLARCAAEDSRIRLIDNPRRAVASALNLGLAAARGRIVVRMDAHAIYDADYLVQSLQVMQDSGCHAVGGVQRPRPGAATLRARAIAAAQRTGLFAGRAAHRRPGFEGPAASLWLGAFPRDLALRIGGFDEELHRTEDNDFYQRMRRTGARLWISSRIGADYLCRPTYAALARQLFANGAEIAPTLLRNPRALPLRHLAPALAGLTLVSLAAVSVSIGRSDPRSSLGLATAACLLSVYALTVLIGSLLVARRSGAALLAPLLVAYPLAHLSQAAGALFGLLRAPFAPKRGPRPRARYHSEATKA